MPASLRFEFNYADAQVFRRQRMIETSLDTLPLDDHAARARALAALAATQAATEPELAIHTARAAAGHAERAGDELSHAWALVARCVTDLSPDSLPERVQIGHDLMTMDSIGADYNLVSTAYFLRLGALVEQGEINRLDEELSPTGPSLARHPDLAQGRQAMWFRCLRATLDGQAGRAEQFAHHGYALAQEMGDPDGEAVWAGQLAIVRWMQGRITELEPAFLHGRQHHPRDLIWAVSLAWVWLRQGRTSAARGLIATLAELDSYPRDRNWLAALSIFAVVASELGEPASALHARQLLLPFADRLATIGLGVTCWGTVARPIALVSQLLGEEDVAIEYYRKAIEVSARTGAQPWLAEAQAELAHLLADRDDGIDLEEALALASEAVASARALQLHGIESAAAAVRAALEARLDRANLQPSPQLEGASDTDSGMPECAQPRIQVLGGFEVVGPKGTPVRWQSRKARDLLKILIARRGAPIQRETVMDLLWPEQDPARLGNRLAVAASTVRRALDPSATHPGDHYLATRDGLFRLRTQRVRIDVEEFLNAAQQAQDSTVSPHIRAERLARAVALHTGEVFLDEPDAIWAERLRRQVHSAHLGVLHASAELAQARGDLHAAVHAYREILQVEPFDQGAHEGLIRALDDLRAPSEARLARENYGEALRELGIEPTPL